jgi:hypothetical protein
MTDATALTSRAQLLDGLGPRAERRMTPRLHIALAGAGALIAIAGAIGLGGDDLVDDDGDVHRLRGVLVVSVLLAVGIALLTRVRTGAIAIGASTAVAVGVPVLVFFLTVKADGFPPFSFDAVLGVSALVWLVLYAVGPARGRMVLLVGALVFAPIFVMEEVEDISSVPEAVGASFTNAFGGSSSSFDSGSGATIDPETGEVTFDDGAVLVPGDDFEQPDFPDPTNLGLIALVFGLVYIGAAYVLTGRRLEGTATPFAAVGSISSFFGLTLLGDDLREIGTGVCMVALGAALLFVGAAGARRFTTWFGGFSVGIGVIVLVGKAIGDAPNTTMASLVFLLVGIAVVAAAQLLSASVGEPAEEDQRRSFRARTRQEPDQDDPAPPDDTVFAPPTSP